MSRAFTRSVSARARAAREVPVSVQAHMAQPCEGREAAGRNQNRQLMRGGRA
jgi:hypothetical protein